MGNLFTSLLNSAGAIQVYNRQLAVLQSNISNANTPGYVRQTQMLEAMHLDLDQGLAGGVTAGPVISSRSQYAEQSVRRPFSDLGYAEQQAADLSQLEPLFNLTTEQGISGSISTFFKTFSQLSINPNDGTVRQMVLENAGGVAASFNQMANGIANTSHEVDSQIRGFVNSINQIGKQIASINAVFGHDFHNQNDAGLDANLNSALEQLAEYSDFSVIRDPDGTANIYLGGQTPLVVGSREFEIAADFSEPQTAVRNTSGQDISSMLSGGKLAGALAEKNDLLPTYKADLNKLAETLASQVNNQLAAGLDANGLPPTENMFTFDSEVGAAISLRVGALTPDQIAAASPDGPGGNTNALNIADMVNAKSVDGYTYNEFFGTIGARLGRDLAGAKSEQDAQQSLLDQARTMRSQISGVSLDQEAAQLLQVQRAYQATGKLVSVLDEILDTMVQTFMR